MVRPAMVMVYGEQQRLAELAEGFGLDCQAHALHPRPSEGPHRRPALLATPSTSPC
jgi:hypothetical protein